MKRLMLAVVLSGVVLAASAQTPAVQPEAPAAAAVAAVPAEKPVADKDDNVAPRKATLAELNCVQQTGSRLRTRSQAGKCNGVAGNSYSREELLRTGRGGIGDAVRTLDMSVR